MTPGKIQKADVSRVSPSSERIDELSGIVGLYASVEELCHWSHEFVNKLVECEVFIDPVRIECTQLKDEFLFEIFAAFCAPVLWRE